MEAHLVLGVEAKTACSIDELLKCQEEINREIISISSFSNLHIIVFKSPYHRFQIIIDFIVI